MRRCRIAVEKGVTSFGVNIQESYVWWLTPDIITILLIFAKGIYGIPAGAGN